MANRTFVRLGALKGACAALCKAAAVCIAGYYARVKPAVRAGCALTGACAALRIAAAVCIAGYCARVNLTKKARRFIIPTRSTFYPITRKGLRRSHFAHLFEIFIAEKSIKEIMLPFIPGLPTIESKPTFEECCVELLKAITI